MIITIEGNPDVGKTYLAKKILRHNRRSVLSVTQSEISKPFSVYVSRKCTGEVINVDDIRTEDFEKVYSVFTQNELKY